MFYRDPIYGDNTIDEPVLIALMESAAMQRLRGVLQHGISGLIGITSPITRFEHSVGAMLLVRRLGVGIEEQIAALLHDVSHTAFSHVIDYVFDGHDEQSYHDREKERYLAQTDVPQILTGFGYDWRLFLEEEDFPLLEQPSPRLCADRVDYFLRDAHDLGLASMAELTWALSHLRVGNGRMVMDDVAAATWMAYTFIKADDASWSNFREVGVYEVTAQAIRRGLAVGAIGQADIWGTDAAAWQKLHQHPDEELQRWLRLVSTETQFVWDAAAPHFTLSTKIRTIDPDVVGEDGRLRPLSTLDPAFAQHRAAYLTQKQGKWPMRYLNNLNHHDLPHRGTEMT
ncbi:MAG: HD domain-containing protein [Anaerolineae bacterium]|nr:HD domain-containing protein [Anaerolineae bacterium]